MKRMSDEPEESGETLRGWELDIDDQEGISSI